MAQTFTRMGYKTTMELARDASDELVWQNGDSLNEYGVDVKVVELPGHTKGSIGLAIED